MSYFEKINIQASDSPSIDAFARWRVSNPKTLFDSKLTFSASLNTFWTTRTWGNATSSYSPYDSKTILSVGTASGSRVVEQTKQWFVYEPGKSLLIVITGVLGKFTPGIVKYIMYGNDTHGIGFCQSGSSFGVFKRDRLNETTITTTFVSQSNWNIDKFDGTGISGKTLNPLFAQIYFMDMEWLGVGRLRYGVFQGGVPYYVHQFSHINELTTTYMGNPNLPIRYEIVNQSGSATTCSMRHICCSVTAEGGTDNLGNVHSVDLGNTAVSIPGNTNCALLFMRHITGSLEDVYRGNSAKLTPIYVDILPTANVATRYSLLLNPVVANSSSLSWRRTQLFSTEYATGSATTTITTEGDILASGYIAASTVQAKSNANITIDPFFGLGEDLFGNRDTLVLAVQTLGATTCDTYASLGFRETI